MCSELILKNLNAAYVQEQIFTSILIAKPLWLYLLQKEVSSMSMKHSWGILKSPRGGGGCTHLVLTKNAWLDDFVSMV